MKKRYWIAILSVVLSDVFLGQMNQDQQGNKPHVHLQNEGGVQ